jgi:hypothetical protein
MADIPRCPQCGAELAADVAAGLCPECLLKQGFGSETGRSAAPDPATAGAGAAEPRSGTSQGAAPTTPFALPRRFVPPEPEELARRFPQLEILELLGTGGMGAVYKARQPALDRLVALKILPPEVGQDPSFAERFTREARALAKLGHQHIVIVHDFGQAGDLYYFIMEFVDGANLRQVISRRRLEPRDALAIVPQICDALQYAHDDGVVHRDIKPENILITRRGRVKIADFGLAKLLHHGADDSPASGRPFTLTGSRQVMGTPHYMAPEQMETPLAVDHRADIYSLGVVFHEMLTGELPLGRFAPPSQRVQMDVRLDEVVLRSLEKEPERRYQHASEVKTDVESISRSSPSAAAASVPPIVPLVTKPAAAVHDWASLGGLVVSPLVTAEREEARNRVAGPAIGLIVAGVLGCLPLLTFAAYMRLSVNAFGAERLIPLGALLAIPVASVFGAVKMLRLRSYGWAIAASVLALLPVPSGPFWLIGLPIGIWSLVVLSRSDVKAAFHKRKNPFGLPDVYDPEGSDVQTFARSVSLPGDDKDPNALPWSSATVQRSPDGSWPSSDSLDGFWYGRWNGGGAGDRWVAGTALVRSVENHVYIQHKDGPLFLIESCRVGRDLLVGRYMNVDMPSDSYPWVGRIVSPERIDGQWTFGRWDFQRKVAEDDTGAEPSRTQSSEGTMPAGAGTSGSLDPCLAKLVPGVDDGILSQLALPGTAVGLAGGCGVGLAIAFGSHALALAWNGQPITPGIGSLAFMALLTMPVSWVCVLAGLHMRSCQRYSLAGYGSLFAATPLHLGWPIGLPAGIWAIRVLNRPEVKAAFQARAAQARPRLLWRESLIIALAFIVTGLVAFWWFDRMVRSASPSFAPKSPAARVGGTAQPTIRITGP